VCAAVATEAVPVGLPVVTSVPVNVGAATVPAGVYFVLMVASVPEKLGLETVPAGVNV
jgi:hypothetical protein